MRHQRRVLMFWPAILTVVAGSVAAPATAPADGEATEAAGESGPATPELVEPVPPAAPPPTEPTTSTTPITPLPTTVPKASDPLVGQPAGSDEAPPAATVLEPSDAPVDPPVEGDEAPPPRTTAPVVVASTAPPSPSLGGEASGAAPVESGSPVTTTGSPVAEAIAPAPSADDLGAVPADGELATAELDTAHETFALLPDWIVRPISFPVLGPVRFGNDWGACRDDCTRLHEGTDLVGVRMQPLLAAVGGTVTHIRYENSGTAGATITITGADGWYYNYFHVNNDRPGTDDGAAAHRWQVSPLLTVGSPVRAGQVIAYMGDSGNSEGSVPHLHFEIRRPDHRPINPYPSLAAAQWRQDCAPDGGLTLVQDASELASEVVAVIPVGGGGRWLIDADGRVFAEGSALHVATGAGGCAG